MGKVCEANPSTTSDIQSSPKVSRGLQRSGSLRLAFEVAKEKASTSPRRRSLLLQPQPELYNCSVPESRGLRSSFSSKTENKQQTERSDSSIRDARSLRSSFSGRTENTLKSIPKNTPSRRELGSKSEVYRRIGFSSSVAEEGNDEDLLLVKKSARKIPAVPKEDHLTNTESKEAEKIPPTNMRSLLQKKDSIIISRSPRRRNIQDLQDMETRDETPPEAAASDSMISLLGKNEANSLTGTKKPSHTNMRSLLQRADSITITQAKKDLADLSQLAAEDSTSDRGSAKSLFSTRRDSLDSSTIKTIRRDSIDVQSDSTANKEPSQSDGGPGKSAFLNRRDSLDSSHVKAARRDSFDSSYPTANKDPSHSESTHSSVASLSRRKVFFDERRNISFESTQELPPKHTYCYTREDCKKFREHRNTRVLKLTESSDEADTTRRIIFSGVYLTCCHAGAQVENVPSDFLSKEAETALKTCYISSAGHLGLEVLSVPVLRDDYIKRRLQIMDIVSSIQTEFKFLSPNVRADMLRKSLEPVSRPVALFALSCGRSLSSVFDKNGAELKDQLRDSPLLPSLASSVYEMDFSSFTGIKPTSNVDQVVKPEVTSGGEAVGRRRVSFKEEHSVVGSAANEDCIVDCWYTREENQSFRYHLAEEVDELKQSETEADSKYKGILSGLYLTCCHAEEEGGNASVSFLPRQAKESLRLCLSDSDRLGLEMMALQCLRDDNVHRRKDHLKRVMSIQKKIKARPYLANVRAEAIQQGAEPISLPSRLFALEMAFALAPSTCPSVQRDREEKLLNGEAKRLLCRSNSNRKLFRSDSNKKLVKTNSHRNLVANDSKQKKNPAKTGSELGSSEKKSTKSPSKGSVGCDPESTRSEKKIVKSGRKKKPSTSDDETIEQEKKSSDEGDLEIELAKKRASNGASKKVDKEGSEDHLSSATGSTIQVFA